MGDTSRASNWPTAATAPTTIYDAGTSPDIAASNWTWTPSSASPSSTRDTTPTTRPYLRTSITSPGCSAHRHLTANPELSLDHLVNASKSPGTGTRIGCTEVVRDRTAYLSRPSALSCTRFCADDPARSVMILPRSAGKAQVSAASDLVERSLTAQSLPSTPFL